MCQRGPSVHIGESESLDAGKASSTHTHRRNFVSRTEDDVPPRREVESHGCLARTGESSNVSADIASGLFVVRYSPL